MSKFASCSAYLLILLAMLLVACQSAPPPPTATPDPEQDPTSVARMWFTAYADGDGINIARHTCNALQEEIKQAATMMNLFTSLSGVSVSGISFDINSEFDMRDVEFRIAQHETNRVTVQVSGQITVAAGAVFETAQLDQELVLVYESGRWRVCGELAASATDVPPVASVSDVNVANNDGWRVFVTNLRETPSDRGWKNIVVDVVFESTTEYPTPLFSEKHVGILDSTGNWRYAYLCCSEAVLGGAPDGAIVLPAGVRFIRSSDPVRVPENATLEQFKVLACTAHSCNAQGVTLTFIVNEVITDPELVFPYHNTPSNIPLLSSEPVPVTFPGNNNANVTFLPGITLVKEDWYSVQWQITVENLTGNDIFYGDIPRDWIVTSVTEDGVLNESGVSCGNGTIPPAYIDTLQCSAVITYNEEADFEKLWIKFARGSAHFLQAELTGEATDSDT